MSMFFKPDDFYTPGDIDTMNTPIEAAETANELMAFKGIHGFSQKHRGEWTFTERPMIGDTHNALLLNLGAIEPCAHESHKVVLAGYSGVDGTYYTCECGVEVEPAIFVEKKK